MQDMVGRGVQGIGPAVDGVWVDGGQFVESAQVVSAWPCEILGLVGWAHRGCWSRLRVCPGVLLEHALGVVAGVS